MAVVAQPAPGGFGFGLPLQRQRAVGVVLAGNGRFGVGVSEQDQFAHGLPLRAWRIEVERGGRDGRVTAPS